MRWFTLFALLAPALGAAAQTDVSPRQNVQLPECMKVCASLVPKTANQNCFGDSTTANGTLPCECRATLNDRAVQACYQQACKPKEIFSMLDTISIACNEPVRNKGISYRTTIIVFFTMSTIAMVMRYSTAFTIGRTTWLDNANMGAAFILNLALFICCIKMSYMALGRDMWKVESHTITSTLQYFWVSEIVYFASIGLVKTSFLIFYLQIFPLKSFRNIVWSCIGFNYASTIACTIAAAFVCSPVSFAWTQWDGEHTGTCVNNNNLAFAHAGLGIVMDFITLLLPVTQIWNLHMSTRKKVGVLMMFSVGAFVTVVSILRLKSLVHFAKTQNMTWDYLEASLWSVIETEVGMVCACMPSIRLGMARVFPKLMGSSVDSKSRPTGGNGSHGNTLGTQWSTNGIGVTTSVRVSHAMRPQTHDQASFVQLVEIDADQKSAKSNSSDERKYEQTK